MDDLAELETSGAESVAVPEKKPPRQKKWRAIVAIVLLVIGCIMIPLAVTGGWVRGTLFDTQGFVDTMGPLAEDPAVQEAIAHSLTTRTFERLDLEAQLQEALPDRLGFLAGPAVDRLQVWSEDIALRLVASDQFPAIWERALEGVHSRVVGFLDGSGRVQLGPEGTIELDLTDISQGIVQRLEERGISIPGDRLSELGTVPIAQVKALESVASILNLVNKVFIVLPILTVLFLAGSVLVAQRRRKAAVRVGIGMMIATAVFIVALFIVRTVFLNAVHDAGFAGDAAEAVWGTLTVALRATSWGLFLLGVLLLIHPRIVDLVRGDRMTAIAAKSAESGQDYGAVGRWVSAHRTLLAIVVLILGFLVLVLWNTPPLFGVILVAALVIVLEALVFFLAKQSDLVAEAASAPGAGRDSSD